MRIGQTLLNLLLLPFERLHLLPIRLLVHGLDVVLDEIVFSAGFPRYLLVSAHAHLAADVRSRLPIGRGVTA